MGIKTKTVCVKKQRKVSSKTSSQAEVIGDNETNDILIDDSEVKHGGSNAISMESMVCLPDPSLTPFYLDAIHLLKNGNYKLAEDNLSKIIR